VKYCEIIADRLSKAGWSLGWVSAIDTRAGEQSGLLTHIAVTGGGSLCVWMKSSARFWNSKRRFAACRARPYMKIR
jgi:hypothetical protein